MLFYRLFITIIFLSSWVNPKWVPMKSISRAWGIVVGACVAPSRKYRPLILASWNVLASLNNPLLRDLTTIRPLSRGSGPSPSKHEWSTCPSSPSTPRTTWASSSILPCFIELSIHTRLLISWVMCWLVSCSWRSSRSEQYVGSMYKMGDIGIARPAVQKTGSERQDRGVRETGECWVGYLRGVLAAEGYGFIQLPEWELEQGFQNEKTGGEQNNLGEGWFGEC